MEAVGARAVVGKALVGAERAAEVEMTVMVVEKTVLEEAAMASAEGGSRRTQLRARRRR